jgi:hypothetical protein
LSHAAPAPTAPTSPGGHTPTAPGKFARAVPAGGRPQSRLRETHQGARAPWAGLVTAEAAAVTGAGSRLPGRCCSSSSSSKQAPATSSQSQSRMQGWGRAELPKRPHLGGAERKKTPGTPLRTPALPPALLQQHRLQQGDLERGGRRREREWGGREREREREGTDAELRSRAAAHLALRPWLQEAPAPPEYKVEVRAEQKGRPRVCVLAHSLCSQAGGRGGPDLRLAVWGPRIRSGLTLAVLIYPAKHPKHAARPSGPPWAVLPDHI